MHLLFAINDRAHVIGSPQRASVGIRRFETRMIKSMTGFARGEAEIKNARVFWEVRSVNHRYLDVQLKLPDGFRVIEPELRRVVAEHVGRGKVDATLNLRWLSEHTPETRLNMAYVRQLLDHLRTLADLMEKPTGTSPATILRWPGVLEEEAADLEPVLPAAVTALGNAMSELCESRAREGAKVHQLLIQRCTDVETLVAAIQKRLPQVLVDIRQRLDERVRSLAAQPERERLEQELAIIAQKLDVSEELDRLAAHAEEVRATLTKDEPVGRRLDFLMQELNREANTLASKSADVETTQQAVELKVLIEQMREQVQNLE